MEVMIHAYPKRMWYVEQFLVPSLKEQGITDITIYNDEHREGNLLSCMKSFQLLKGEGETWHLQDDVVVCSDFAQRAESMPEGIVCGFCSEVGKEWNPGYQYSENMWYSFPCIKIPNNLAREFAEWFFTDASKNRKYWAWLEGRKFDDSFFRDFLLLRYKTMKVYNVKPNLVNHIDYMLGGSIANKNIVGVRTSVYWDDIVTLNNLWNVLKTVDIQK